MNAQRIGSGAKTEETRMACHGVRISRRGGLMAGLVGIASILCACGVGTTAHPNAGPATSSTGSAPTTVTSRVTTQTVSESPTTVKPAMLGAGIQGSASQVPWSIVGPGWILASETGSGSASGGALPGGQLYLIDPQGGRYLIGPSPTGSYLEDVSGDGSRALLYGNISPDGSTQMYVMDLKTGTTETLDINNGYGARFTLPSGAALIAQGNQSASGAVPVERLSLSGAVELTYPTQFSGSATTNGQAIESPDGTQLVLETAAGGEVVTNSGQPVRFLPFPAGTTTCAGVRWWIDEQILVTCADGLWAQPVGGGAPTQVTDGHGDENVWSLPSGLYSESAFCGNSGFTKLSPGGAGTETDVPGLAEGDSVQGIGAFGAQILEMTGPAGCRQDTTGETSPATDTLAWYDPATGSVVPVLGDPVNGGFVDRAIMLSATGPN